MFEYQDGIKEVASSGIQCPPANASEKNRDGWRWVQNPLTNECFQPVAIRNPPRLHRESNGVTKCSCWALSMHDTEQESISAFKALEKNFKLIRKTLGTFVAKTKIDVTHGRSTKSDDYGHFDLHPYKGAPLINSVTEIKAIP